MIHDISGSRALIGLGVFNSLQPQIKRSAMQTYTIEKKQSGPYDMILGHWDARSKSHAFKQMKKDLKAKGETVPKRKNVNIYTYF